MTDASAAGERFMRASDAFSWYMEQDPVLRSTVLAVVWLDRSPDWETVAAKLEQASRRVPMFRQRVVELPGRVTPPRWTDAGDFDLSWHLRRVEAPVPKDDSVVMDMARREAMTGFDRAHPLWQFTLVEGLEGGRSALIMRIHHSLTDGLGGMQLALMLFDQDRGLHPPPGEPRPEVEPAPGTVGMLAERLGSRALSSLGFVTGRVRSGVPDLVAGVRQPVRTVSSALGQVASIARTVAPVRQTMSPLMTGRSLKRYLGSVTVPMEQLRAASAAAGGSLNDGFVTAMAGGLRLYHERHGVQVERLRVTMPISLRTARDRPGGNRITLIRFPVPVAEANPARRLAGVRKATQQARHEPSLPLTDAIAGALNLLPPAVIGSILRNVDFLASDVPGFDRPVFLAGAEVERYEAYGPTTGSAVNATLLSYNGRCHVGINIDTTAVPDPEVLIECVRAGFEEVLALSRSGPAGNGDTAASRRNSPGPSMVETVAGQRSESPSRGGGSTG